jgi:hypothetical protein
MKTKLLQNTGRGVPVVIPHNTFKLSDEAKRKLAEIDRRQARFYQTAHLYWFD